MKISKIVYTLNLLLLGSGTIQASGAPGGPQIDGQESEANKKLKTKLSQLFGFLVVAASDGRLDKDYLNMAEQFLPIYLASRSAPAREIMEGDPEMPAPQAQIMEDGDLVGDFEVVDVAYTMRHRVGGLYIRACDVKAVFGIEASPEQWTAMRIKVARWKLDSSRGIFVKGASTFCKRTVDMCEFPSCVCECCNPCATLYVCCDVEGARSHYRKRHENDVLRSLGLRKKIEAIRDELL